MDLRHRIRVLRETNNWSQRELAQRVGVNGTAVCQWESGGKRPSLDNLVRLTEVFGVSMTELTGR